MEDYFPGFTVIFASTIALLITTVLAQDGASSAPRSNRGFFNASLGSVVTLPGEVLSLRGHIAFSFRTCSQGSLLRQSGGIPMESPTGETTTPTPGEDNGGTPSGDSLEYSLTTEGLLRLSWTHAGESDSVTIATDSLLSNEWFTVDTKFLQGRIHLTVERGSTILKQELISNSTYRRFLWDLDLGSGVTVGSGFTGCIQGGPSVQLGLESAVATEVRWGKCPLEEADYPSCGGAQDFPCASYPCLNGGICEPLGSDYQCQCPTFYRGKNCEQDLGSQGCELSPCVNGATCIPRETGTRKYECRCVPGYTGVNCEIDIDECQSMPCRNGGQCANLINGFSCDCVNTGYEGDQCQTNIDECAVMSPCLNSALCTDTPGSYKCQCPTGFAGRNCEDGVDECESNPCQAGGTCTGDVGFYTCACAPGFTGLNCEVNIDDCVGVTCADPLTICKDGVNSHQCVCKPGYTGEEGGCLDINECASDPCVNGASCFNAENMFECECAPGYGGVTCSININECESDPCLNGAECEDLINGYDCSCLAGFEGVTCGINIDECASNPCVNGATCNDLVNGYNCTCATGWAGLQCGTEIQECASNPCMNGAECVDSIGFYSCLCPVGFSGTNCETNINDCDPDPCQNTAPCADLVNDYTCMCGDEWMGKNCDLVYDACSFTPCQNGGTCATTPPSRDFTCACALGFTGAQCETNINDCANNNCETFQVCVDGINEFSCQCPIGYEGDLCDQEIDECASSPCENGGQCINGIGNYTCVCDTGTVDLSSYTGDASRVYKVGFEGVNCEIPIDECAYKPPICLNNGICQNNNNTFTCYCGSSASGSYYTGPYCEKVKEYCDIVEDPPACKNGGTCNSLRDTYECECAPGFTGERCEDNINECDSSPCLYNGTCSDGVNGYTCECVDGLTGTHCEENINECASSPCLNNGLCVDRINRYECDCSGTGFNGTLCEENINDCDPNPCAHGVECTDGINTFECDCYPGYEGQTCDVDIDECASSPCENGATCWQRSDVTRDGFDVTDAQGFECLCPAGFTGIFCQININECESSPCVNGTCFDRVDHFTCACDPGYQGYLCDKEINECAELKPCLYGSTCIDMIADYQCVCPPLFLDKPHGGKNCTNELTGCNTNNCQNNATCMPYLVNEATDAHNYTCDCAPGWTGFYCDVTTSMTLTGNSWAAALHTANKKNLHLSLMFRTTLGDGILALVEGTVITNWVLLALEDNYNIKLYYNWGGNKKQLVTSVPGNIALNDAQWHKVEMSIVGLELKLTLYYDDTGLCPNGRCTVSLTTDAVFDLGTAYVGSNATVIDLEGNYPGFIGCVQDVSFDRVLMIPAQVITNQEMAQNVQVGCDRSEQCFEDSCNSQGSCTDLWYKNSCACNRPYFGATCKNSFTPATFGFGNRQSYLQYSIPDDQRNELRDSVDMSMFFRTRTPEGFIFYLGADPATPQVTYITAYLENGQLVVQVQLNSNSERWPYKMAERLDDGAQHYLNVNLNKDKLNVIIDDVTFPFKPINAAFGLSAELLLMGSVPPPTAEQGETPGDTPPTGENPTQGSPSEGNPAENPTEGNPTQENPTQGNPTETSEGNPTEGSPSESNSTAGNPSGGNSTQGNPEVTGESQPVETEEPPKRRKRAVEDIADTLGSDPDEFKGTLQDVRLNGKLVPFFPENDTSHGLGSLEPPAQSVNVERGEKSDDVCTASAPCLNNGVCTNVFFNDFQCQCPDQFTGKTCASTNFCFTGGCPVGSTCNNLVDGYECVSPATFNGQTSYVQYTNTVVDPNRPFEVRLKLRTRATSGVVFHMAGTGSPSGSYFTLEIIKSGALQLKFNVGSSGTITTEPINDAEWHDVIITADPNSITVTLDDVASSMTTRELTTSVVDLLRDSFNVYLGGVDGSYFTNSDALFTGGQGFYKGCMDGVRVGGVLLPFYRESEQGPTGAAEQFTIRDSQGLRPGCISDPVCDTDGCTNGATCVDEWNQFSCQCVTGFEGDNCETNINDCPGHQCQNGASCIDGINQYNCACIPGFTGLRCETDINECESSPCMNNATCVDLENEYMCNCAANYTGVNCEIEITENCDADPCYNNATCESFNTTQPGVVSFNCTCLPGYTGRLCESEIDYCESINCSNGATCRSSLKLLDYNCECVPGYEGRQCEAEILECASNPCKNGAACEEQINGYKCKCSEGWEGENCELNIDECAGNATLSNGLPSCERGVCQDEQGSYQCDCTGTGYRGSRCEEQINECLESPCLNGASCNDTDGDYQCNCTLGYEGKNCDQPSCDVNQCFNGSTCRIENNRWECLCPLHYVDEQCKTRGRCADAPCQNGGECTQSPDGQNYTCQCTSGWTGENCTENIDECTDIMPCKNGATCVDTDGDYNCTCAPGWDGKDCTEDINECDSDPCVNGATCEDRVNGFNCSCTPEWEGPTCAVDRDECADLLDPCSVRGNCTNISPGFSCDCYDGFIGDTCHSEDVCFDTNPDTAYCMNGGNCTLTVDDVNDSATPSCDCIAPWEGPTCATMDPFVKPTTTGRDSDLVPLIAGLAVGVVVLIVIIAVIAFLVMARSKRATRGTYSPSRQEMSGSRVEMGMHLKPPPEERLI